MYNNPNHGLSASLLSGLSGVAVHGGSQISGQQVPRTVSSAASRLEHLNERLSTLLMQTSVLSDQIGGPRPITGTEAKNAGSPPQTGAVDRLNDAAEMAHAQLDTLENLLGSISRSLG